jgi:hypothetical protein
MVFSFFIVLSLLFFLSYQIHPFPFLLDLFILFTFALLINTAETLSEEDHGTTGTTKRLVGGGGDDVSMFERTRQDTSSNQTGDVGHISHQVSTTLIGNLILFYLI